MANTVFNGPDCRIHWNDSTGSYYLIQDTTGIYDVSPVFVGNVNIKNYKVEVYTIGDSLLRTEYTKSNIDTNYNYTYDKNFEDNSGVPVRTFKFKVYSVNLDDTESVSPSLLTVSNPAPDMSAITPITSAKPGYIKVEWTSVNDNDMSYYELYADGSAVQTISYPETDAEYADVTYGDNYDIQILPYDLFGVGVISQTEIGTPAKMSAVDFELSGSIVMTDSDSNSAATLSELYDRVTDTDGVEYTVSGTDKWIQYYYEIIDYVDRVKIWCDSTASVYMAISKDVGSTWTYYKADTDHQPTDAKKELIEATNQADAITNYWELSEGENYAAFPNNIVGDTVRLYITGTYTVTIYEFIPARMLQAEMAVVDELSTITAHVGLLNAGIVQSTNFDDGGVKLDLDNDRMDVYDDLGILRVRLGKLT